jgi:ABC-type polysaccharide/polyol phosphate export permease
MLKHLATVWRYRHFWLSMVRMDLKTRYRRSVLGVGWSLMHPLMMTVVFCFVFSAWMPIADWRATGPYFLIGMTVFNFIRDSAWTGCYTFFRNENYIRQCPLPLTIYTLRTLLGAGIHFLIAFGVTFVAVLILQPSRCLELLSHSWVFIPVLIMLFLFCWSISVLLAYMTIFFHDTVQITEVAFQVLFFLSPIMYPVQMIVDRGAGVLLKINPIAVFLELIRLPLLDGQIPTNWAFAKAAIIVVTAGGMAIGTIAWLEKKMIFHL